MCMSVAQVEEEAEHKADLQRQLSKANAESQMWRQKYEQDGLARYVPGLTTSHSFCGMCALSKLVVVPCVYSRRGGTTQLLHHLQEGK